jgi:hypothetical protein
LTQREREMFARELASIEEQERLEEEARRTGVCSDAGVLVSPTISSPSPLPVVPEVLDTLVHSEGGVSVSSFPDTLLGWTDDVAFSDWLAGGTSSPGLV